MTREEVEEIMGTEPKIQASFEVIGDDVKFIKLIVNGKEKVVSIEELVNTFPEPCEDCIFIPKGAIKVAGEDYITYKRDYLKKWWQPELALLGIDLSSIQSKPKIGHWEQYGYSWEDKFKCSECGEEQPKILCGERIIGHWSDYCPNCGADMRESEDNG